MHSNYKIRDEHVTAQAIGDTMYIINQSNGLFFQLNILGTHVWKHIELGRETATIISLLKERFENVAEIESDILNFISDLVEAELISY
jgi:hypothetical protein